MSSLRQYSRCRGVNPSLRLYELTVAVEGRHFFSAIPAHKFPLLLRVSPHLGETRVESFLLLLVDALSELNKCLLLCFQAKLMGQASSLFDERECLPNSGWTGHHMAIA